MNRIRRHGRLKVSYDGRRIIHEDGTPFFWLADTAWELFHKLSLEETEKYFANRISKGFSVIMAVALAELDGLRTPNFYGDVPFEDLNPSFPAEAYFRHIDRVIHMAAEKGLYIAMLPTWGDKVQLKYDWAKGPEIFDESTAYSYGCYLGERYGSVENVVWILGGDRDPAEKELVVWRAMARGLGDGLSALGARSVKPLMSFHPQPFDGGSSSRWFHRDNWLSFNMLQTGHDRDTPTYERIGANYLLHPAKPVIDGEPTYEAHGIGFQPKQRGYSTDYDVRKYAYWGLFAGAFGHTYGCHSVWQFHREGETGVNFPIYSWEEALDLAGACQMAYVVELMGLPELIERVPANELLIGRQEAGPDYIVVTAAKNGRLLLVYTPAGRSFSLDGNALAPADWEYCWFSPRDGQKTIFREVLQKDGGDAAAFFFAPPSCGSCCDWVLIMRTT